MVDWRWPKDRAKRDEARSHEPLATVSHLASSGKHFAAEARRHRSVENVTLEHRPSSQPELQKLLEAGAGTAKPFIIYAQMGIFLRLVRRDGSVQDVSALQLAGLVLAFWTTELGPAGRYAVGLVD